MGRKRRVILFRPHIPLYPGEDDQLIAWVNSLNRLPFGGKSQAVKDALRRGIGLVPDNAPSTSPVLDLAEIRAVVEAAVAQALARSEGQMSVASVGAFEDEETEAILDHLGATLVLDEE